MTNELNEQVRKIVDNYLGRLRGHLKGLPDQDREELVREIYSHIYDSYNHNETDDEVQRILVVLERLGEPSEVVSSRLSESMTTMGKRRNLPLLILAGFFIGIFGLPLGIGGIAILIGLGVTLAALIFTYFVCAGAFVLAGWLSVVVTTVRLFVPDFMVDHIQLLDQVLDPSLAIPLNYAVSVLFLLLGAFMIWQGQHILRGARYLFSLPGESIRHLRKKRWFAAAQKKGAERVALRRQAE
jgi:uncharacterized membrane protein